MLLKSHFVLLRRPLVVWLAVLITLFGALAPTVSHALALTPGTAPAMHVICTSTGVQSQATSVSPDSADGQESAPSLEHCPFCLLLHDRVAPAPHSLVHLFDVLSEHQAPTVRQAFFFFTILGLAPPPRGPPVLS